MKEENIHQHKKYLTSQQYKSDINLNARIRLHKNFSTNPIGWMEWVANQIQINSSDIVLDIGCGPAGVWSKKLENKEDLHNLILTDLSFGMVGIAKKNIGYHQSYATINAMNLPFQSNSLDVIVANHMMYHVPNVPQSLKDIYRVLKPGGKLYTSTNGENHLFEMMEIMYKFINTINFSRFMHGFSAENGGEKLGKVFESVKMTPHPNQLIVPNSQPIVDYINSMISEEESLILVENGFQSHLDSLIYDNGPFHITKNSVLFEATKY